MPLHLKKIFEQKTNSTAPTILSWLKWKFVASWTEFTDDIGIINVIFQPGLCDSHKINVIVKSEIFKFQGFVDDGSRVNEITERWYKCHTIFMFRDRSERIHTSYTVVLKELRFVLTSRFSCFIVLNLNIFRSFRLADNGR